MSDYFVKKREEFVVKKVLKLILVVALLVSALAIVTACRSEEEAPPAPAETPAPTPEPTPEPDVEDDDDEEEYIPADESAAVDIQIALVAHSPESILNDGSFNEGAWAGITQFLADNNLPSSNARFYQAVAPDNDARFNSIVQAIEGGANVLVMPGFQFVDALYDAQDLFPDVYFILLDATPSRDGEVRIQPNVAAIHYAEAEAGFLAGYAAVMEGHRMLGFMGGNPIPPVIRFGHGFVQGAEHAAQSLGLDAGDVEINYMYLGGFAPAPEHVVTASAWFVGGTEVIFAAAGGAGMSVMAGADDTDGITIGVDSDQHWVNDTVLTSAMKALDVSVHDMLTDILNGSFPGGVQHIYDASINGVGLPMQTSRFENFTQAQYDAIFNQIASGALIVDEALEMADILENVSLVVVNEM